MTDLRHYNYGGAALDDFATLYPAENQPTEVKCLDCNYTIRLTENGFWTDLLIFGRCVACHCKALASRYR